MEQQSKTRGPSHTNRGTLAVFLMFVMGILATPVLSQQLSTNTGPCGVQYSTVGPLEDSCTVAFGTTATTRADYGNLGVYAESHSTSGIQGLAQFQDYLTILGGSGTSSVTVHWTLDGRLYADDTYSTRFGNLTFYANGHALVDIHYEDPCGVSVCYPPNPDVNESGTFEIPFTYGVPFALNVYLRDTVWGPTIGDFQDGGTVAFELNPGDTLAAASGTSYPIINSAPELSCLGFGSPMDKGVVTVKKNRVLPLKMQLFDQNAVEVTSADVIAPPVVQVLFTPETGGDPIDVTDEALSAGQGSDGNQFVFTDDLLWQFNLKTSDYTAPGTYEITVASGDDSEYQVDPTCQAEFVIN